jgi:hypothetical protein
MPIKKIAKPEQGHGQPHLYPRREYGRVSVEQVCVVGVDWSSTEAGSLMRREASFQYAAPIAIEDILDVALSITPFQQHREIQLQVRNIVHFLRNIRIAKTAVKIEPMPTWARITGELANMVNVRHQRFSVTPAWRLSRAAMWRPKAVETATDPPHRRVRSSAAEWDRYRWRSPLHPITSARAMGVTGNDVAS